MSARRRSNRGTDALSMSEAGSGAHPMVPGRPFLAGAGRA